MNRIKGVHLYAGRNTEPGGEIKVGVGQRVWKPYEV